MPYPWSILPQLSVALLLLLLAAAVAELGSQQALDLILATVAA
jgi:hypothetical protein